MKKILAFALALVMVFSLTACGDEDFETGESTVEESTQEESIAEESDPQEDVAEETGVNDFTAEVEALEPMLVHNYSGHSPEMTDPYGGVSFNEDYTHAVFVLFNGTEYHSYQGACTFDEEQEGYVIDDPNEEYLLVFTLTDNEDGWYTLDAGDFGAITVAETTVEASMSLLKLFFVSEAAAA